MCQMFDKLHIVAGSMVVLSHCSASADCRHCTLPQNSDNSNGCMQLDRNPVLVQAAALLQEFADEVMRCQELPEGEKPSKKHWKGHFLQRLQAIQAFALEAAEDAQTTLALQSIKVPEHLPRCVSTVNHICNTQYATMICNNHMTQFWLNPAPHLYASSSRL